ncbi:hypothetical protein V8G54_023785 [Vigna mungo]|uniref:Uncharacterized protein n=1 Tax=Vigna mungo TaxID=3915 RepID=A0AAQ3RPI8_VIGMU
MTSVVVHLRGRPKLLSTTLATKSPHYATVNAHRHVVAEGIAGEGQNALHYANPSPIVTPRVVVFMVHGYDNDISWTFQATPIFLTQSGFTCFAVVWTFKATTTPKALKPSSPP